jgi:hypothetical protein
MTLEAENLDVCQKFRAHYDEQLARHVGVQVPQPKPGQDVNEYRADCLRTFKRTFLPQTHDMYKVNYRRLIADGNISIFNNFEPMLLEACKVEANNPAHVPRGELRKIEERDPYGQVRVIKFIGQESFVKQMGRPGRRVVKFRQPVDWSGRALT